MDKVAAALLVVVPAATAARLEASAVLTVVAGEAYGA